MKFIFFLAACAYGASYSFYSQDSTWYVVCLLLIFFAGHYAGHVGSKIPQVRITRLNDQVSCEHEFEAKVLREDLTWLLHQLNGPPLNPFSKEFEEISNKIGDIGIKHGVFKGRR